MSIFYDVYGSLSFLLMAIGPHSWISLGCSIIDDQNEMLQNRFWKRKG